MRTNARIYSLELLICALSCAKVMNAYTLTGHWLNLVARNAWLWSRYCDSWALWYLKM
jgi:hypothetical protein